MCNLRPRCHRLTATLIILVAGSQAHVQGHDGEDHGPAATPASAAEPEPEPTTASPVRVGDGKLSFQTVPGWGRIPGSKTLGATHGGIVVDKQGSIYFNVDQGEHAVVVCRPDGTFVRSFGKQYSGIHGMVINEEDGKEFIYAAHLRGAQIVKFALGGRVAWTLGVPIESGKYDEKRKYQPTAVAVGPDGDIYVADGYGQNWVHQFDKDRKYLRSFGGRGKEPGKFQTCHGLALDRRGARPLLLVCDRENRRLQHFDLEGNFVAVIAENLRRPCAVTFHGPRVAVAELEGRVTILDGKNRVIAALGDNPDREQWAQFAVPVSKWQEGIFTAPHGTCFDRAGNLYVMDWNKFGRIRKLAKVTKVATP